jgi:hypothetical protein
MFGREGENFVVGDKNATRDMMGAGKTLKFMQGLHVYISESLSLHSCTQRPVEFLEFRKKGDHFGVDEINIFASVEKSSSLFIEKASTSKSMFRWKLRQDERNLHSPPTKLQGLKMFCLKFASNGIMDNLMKRSFEFRQRDWRL